jgi:hypothetical protein
MAQHAPQREASRALRALWRSRFPAGWYEQWFQFCDRFADRIRENLLLINDDSNSRIVPARDWRAEYARLG